jgi:hypothetical protein
MQVESEMGEYPDCKSPGSMISCRSDRKKGNNVRSRAPRDGDGLPPSAISWLVSVAGSRLGSRDLARYLMGRPICQIISDT